MSVSEVRKKKAEENAVSKRMLAVRVGRMRRAGMTNAAISKETGIPESSLRYIARDSEAKK